MKAAAWTCNYCYNGQHHLCWRERCKCTHAYHAKERLL